jgi:hypothetical protein
MRDLTAGQERVDAPGRTVREVIAALDAAYPGFRDRLCVGDKIDPAITVWIDDRIARLGLMQRVGEGSEIQIRPTVSGG